jgi:hypothetical protein
MLVTAREESEEYAYRDTVRNGFELITGFV